MSSYTKEDPDHLPADGERPEAGWRAAVVQAYLTLVNGIAPNHDRRTPPHPPARDGSAT